MCDSTATVYKAMVDDNLCAVKRYTLEELDEIYLDILKS